RLGRSRRYEKADLPERLTHWHSPRVNRWERLYVTAGALNIERLAAAGTVSEYLKRDDTRWIAPGSRWRIARMSADCAFELEIHAEARSAMPESRPLREALLADAARVPLARESELATLVSSLAPGERCLFQGRFDWREMLRTIMRESGGSVFWHPLAEERSGFIALAVRGTGPVGLAEYLGRDHAVIEAALAGTLRGDAESARWLQATLARHLAIEEELLFPAYVAAGGREAWVRGLMNEHKYLREYLDLLAEPDGRRKFLRLLDGHDEKEERVVYPDIIAHLGAAANDLLESAMIFPVPVTEE
ncbi:MAG: hemerythrin domain-containing protein, partial [Gammaproteobacteria bacterium]